MKYNNTKAFLKLVRAGLWEKETSLSSCGEVDFDEIYRLAQEQAVVGLLAAGLEHVTDVRVPQALALTIAGEVLQLEQRNRAMNEFVVRLIEDLRKTDVYALLVKGQGIAQCYERPLWRACGDVDLLLNGENYEKAKKYLTSIAQNVEEEVDDRKHLGLTIEGWVVELHGTLKGNVLRRIDKGIDDCLRSTWNEGRVRRWEFDNTIVFLPAASEDVVYVFAHILQHLTQGGIGLRQIFDWIRLLFTYKDVIDVSLLERRLKGMGLISEWKVFSAMSVEWLGMPKEAMLLYSQQPKWSCRARRLLLFILSTGNMGHNRDTSYYSRHTYVVSKLLSLKWHTEDAMALLSIFPLDSVKIWGRTFLNGLVRIKQHR